MRRLIDVRNGSKADLLTGSALRAAPGDSCWHRREHLEGASVPVGQIQGNKDRRAIALIDCLPFPIAAHRSQAFAPPPTSERICDGHQSALIRGMPQGEVIETALTIAALKIDSSAERPVVAKEYTFLAAPHLYVVRNAGGEAGSLRVRETAADWQAFEEECGGRFSLLTTGCQQR